MEKRESGLFEGLKAGKEEFVVKLYDLYRSEFIHWCMNNYSTDQAGAADLFQDTVIILYQNIRNHVLQELNSSLKTYLFSIGKNLALKKLRKETRMVVNEKVLELNATHINYDVFEESDKKRVVAKLMDDLGEPCRSILNLFYFHRFTMDAIAERLGYKNENVVKSQKLRCFNTLRKLALEQFDQDDI
ncbi:MAG: sigma-70 family RNA polymerase sigma factor [Bacteroidota bacterium]